MVQSWPISSIKLCFIYLTQTGWHSQSAGYVPCKLVNTLWLRHYESMVVGLQARRNLFFGGTGVEEELSWANNGIVLKDAYVRIKWGFLLITHTHTHTHIYTHTHLTRTHTDTVDLRCGGGGRKWKRKPARRRPRLPAHSRSPSHPPTHLKARPT